MTLLKVGFGLYVSADEIVLLQSFPSRPSRRDKQAAEGAGLYKDGTSSGKRRDPLKTLVHLRCGIVVGSPLTIDGVHLPLAEFALGNIRLRFAQALRQSRLRQSRRTARFHQQGEEAFVFVRVKRERLGNGDSPWQMSLNPTLGYPRVG